MTALLAFVLLAAWRLDPRFLTPAAQSLLASHGWELAIVSLPMLFIVAAGGIDLSVGAIAALAAVGFGLMAEAGMPLELGAAAALALGACLGWGNGALVARGGIHPLIVTLATMALFRGVAEGISSGRAISGFPDGFQRLSSGTLAGVPNPAWIFGLLACAMAWAFRRSIAGRWTVATGQSAPAAALAGVPVRPLQAWLYGASGLLAALAALLFIARTNTAKADLGVGLELEAITAVVLGGASIRGGSGSPAGLLLSLALVHEAREFVSWHWRKDELVAITMGLLLVGAILAERAFGENRVVSRRSREAKHG